MFHERNDKFDFKKLTTPLDNTRKVIATVDDENKVRSKRDNVTVVKEITTSAKPSTTLTTTTTTTEPSTLDEFTKYDEDHVKTLNLTYKEESGVTNLEFKVSI